MPHMAHFPMSSSGVAKEGDGKGRVFQKAEPWRMME